MAVNKTQPTDADVAAFVDAIENPNKRADAQTLLATMARATGEPPLLWDTGIVGFGTYSYRTKSGHRGRWMCTGFAPRVREFTIHIMTGFGRYEAELSKLGPHRHGVSCLYIKRTADLDMAALEAMVASSYRAMRQAYPDD